MQPSAELQRSQQHAVNGEGEAVAEEDRERPARGRRRRNDRTFAQPEPQAQVPEHQPQTQQEIAEPPVEDVDRKSVVEGKSVYVRVDHGGRRIIKKKTTKR